MLRSTLNAMHHHAENSYGMLAMIYEILIGGIWLIAPDGAKCWGACRGSISTR
jgi:hypothetical protein